MIFEILDEDSSLDKIIYGKKGRELSCFIPFDSGWTQLNYGQGEGEVSINSCTWGFYFSDNGLSVALLSGEIKINDAYELLQGIAKKILKDSFSDDSLIIREG